MTGVRGHISAALVLACASAITAAGAVEFIGMWEREPIIAGPGVTKQGLLSEYAVELKGSPGDTPLYLLEGTEAGGSFVLLGGTHPQEISGLLAAVIVIENAVVKRGTVTVIAQANQSGFSHTEPLEGFPHTFTIETSGGPRWFRNGMRLANPIHQWPDPDVFVHRPSGETMVGLEARNLNRNHPGNPSGPLIAQVSHGITSLIRQGCERRTLDCALHGAGVVLDLHEAQPEYPVINMLVAHERAFETAAYATALLADEGVQIDLMASPSNLHGLSHREFGDHANAEAMLSETANPAMGRFRGRTDEALLVEGRDENYVAAATLGRLFVSFDAQGWPLKVRVARQVATIERVLQSHNELHPDDAIIMEGLPTYNDILTNGIGRYLAAPSANHK